jgi:predicted protein tyrosine phosphatase
VGPPIALSQASARPLAPSCKVRPVLGQTNKLGSAYRSVALRSRVLDQDVIAAADVIFVMERHHRDKIRRRLRSVLGQRPVYVLGIPDEYERDQPELIALLKERVPALLNGREC